MIPFPPRALARIDDTIPPGETRSYLLLPLTEDREPHLAWVMWLVPGRPPSDVLMTRVYRGTENLILAPVLLAVLPPGGEAMPIHWGCTSDATPIEIDLRNLGPEPRQIWIHFGAPERPPFPCGVG